MFCLHCSACCLDVSRTERRQGTQTHSGSVDFFPGRVMAVGRRRGERMKDGLGTGVSDSTKVTTPPACTQTSALTRIVCLSLCRADGLRFVRDDLMKMASIRQR